MSGHMMTSDGHHRIKPIRGSWADPATPEHVKAVASKFKCTECGAEFRSREDADSHEANAGWEG